MAVSHFVISATGVPQPRRFPTWPRASARRSMLATSRQAPERAKGGAFVSWNSFRLLRVQPAVGRDFVAEDDRSGAAPVVMLGYGLWQRRYGGDRSAVVRPPSALTTLLCSWSASCPNTSDSRFPATSGNPLHWPPCCGTRRRTGQTSRYLAAWPKERRFQHVCAEVEAKAAHAAAGRASADRGMTSRVEGMENWRIVTMKAHFHHDDGLCLFCLARGLGPTWRVSLVAGEGGRPEPRSNGDSRVTWRQLRPAMAHPPRGIPARRMRHVLCLWPEPSVSRCPYMASTIWGGRLPDGRSVRPHRMR